MQGGGLVERVRLVRGPGRRTARLAVNVHWPGSLVMWTGPARLLICIGRLAADCIGRLAALTIRRGKMIEPELLGLLQ
jgi:hypothetical protein